MTTKIAYLGHGDIEAPFTFSEGDRMAWKGYDGIPDLRLSGQIESGVCEYGGGWYKATYIVRMENGLRFGGGELDLVKLS